MSVRLNVKIPLSLSVKGFPVCFSIAAKPPITGAVILSLRAEIILVAFVRKSEARK